ADGALRVGVAVVSFLVRSSAKACSWVTTGMEETSQAAAKVSFSVDVTYMTSWCSNAESEYIESFWINCHAFCSCWLMSRRLSAARSRTSSSVSPKQRLSGCATLDLTSSCVCGTPNLANAVTAAARTMAFSRTTRL